MALFRQVRVIRTVRELPRSTEHFRWVTTVLVAVALLVVILKSGYGLVAGPVWNTLIHGFNLLVLGVFTADVVVGFVSAPSRLKHLKRRWFDIAVFVPITIALLAGGTGITFIVLRQLLIVGQAFTGSRRFAGVIEEMRLQPLRLLALSFVVMIVIGTLLLTFPTATRDGTVTGFVDALFTATSATCVTGLIVKDTPVYWSRFGQLVILTLLQFGALGIMTFSSSLAVVFGRKLGLGQRKTVSAMIGESRGIDIVRILRYVLTFTVLAEATGALLLFLRWLPDFPTVGAALYNAVFHSVSAFCNAGFSVFSNSLVDYRGDIAVNFVVIGLVITGGLGFIVVRELICSDTFRRGPMYVLRRTSVHARIVLWTTGILIVAGTIFFFFFEYDHALGGMPTGVKLITSLFQAVTPRTAGFNTAHFASVQPATLFLWTMLMFIGASPGGTGGGIKTSTVAILFLSVRSRVLGREEIQLGRRIIPKDIVYRATAIAAVSIGVVALFLIVLLITEDAPFQNILFETVSAFGTVGLSTGLTPELSVIGKVAVTILMYVGRLGPLTLALAMHARRSRPQIGYPDARIMVG